MSQRNDTSVDAFINSARACLRDRAKPLKIETDLCEVSLWLEKRDLLHGVEERIQIKDISEIRPGSKIDMELTFSISDITYKFTIKTIVTESGIFQLRHPELIDIDYPHSDSSTWEELKTFVRENSVSIAGLVLSLFNMALNLMRLKGP